MVANAQPGSEQDETNTIGVGFSV